MSKTAAPAPAPVIDMDALPPSGGSFIRMPDGTIVPAPVPGSATAPALEQDTLLAPVSQQPHFASE